MRNNDTIHPRNYRETPLEEKAKNFPNTKERLRGTMGKEGRGPRKGDKWLLCSGKGNTPQKCRTHSAGERRSLPGRKTSAAGGIGDVRRSNCKYPACGFSLKKGGGGGLWFGGGGGVHFLGIGGWGGGWGGGLGGWCLFWGGGGHGIGGFFFLVFCFWGGYWGGAVINISLFFGRLGFLCWVFLYPQQKAARGRRRGEAKEERGNGGGGTESH